MGVGIHSLEEIQSHLGLPDWQDNFSSPLADTQTRADLPGDGAGNYLDSIVGLEKMQFSVSMKAYWETQLGLTKAVT